MHCWYRKYSITIGKKRNTINSSLFSSPCFREENNILQNSTQYWLLSSHLYYFSWKMKEKWFLNFLIKDHTACSKNWREHTATISFATENNIIFIKSCCFFKKKNPKPQPTSPAQYSTDRVREQLCSFHTATALQSINVYKNLNYLLNESWPFHPGGCTEFLSIIFRQVETVPFWSLQSSPSLVY